MGSWAWVKRNANKLREETLAQSRVAQLDLFLRGPGYSGPCPLPRLCHILYPGRLHPLQLLYAPPPPRTQQVDGLLLYLDRQHTPWPVANTQSALALVASRTICSVAGWLFIATSGSSTTPLDLGPAEVIKNPLEG